MTEDEKVFRRSPSDFSEGMSTIAITVGTHEVHCPNGWVSKDGKRGTGYIKHYDEALHDYEYLWVEIDLMDSQDSLRVTSGVSGTVAFPCTPYHFRDV